MSFRLGAVTFLACLVWCTAAFASSRQYNGPAGAGNGAGVEFGAKQVHAKPSVVRRFSYFNIPAACKGSAGTAVTGSLTITMKVSAKRRFSGSQTLPGGGPKVLVSGVFARSFKKATGTIRVRGNVPGCAVADTGSVRWSAPAV